MRTRGHPGNNAKEIFQKEAKQARKHPTPSHADLVVGKAVGEFTGAADLGLAVSDRVLEPLLLRRGRVELPLQTLQLRFHVLQVLPQVSQALHGRLEAVRVWDGSWRDAGASGVQSGGERDSVHQ